MKKLILTLLSVTVLSSTGFAKSDKSLKNDKVLATYNNGKVTVADIMLQYATALNSQEATKDKDFMALAPAVQENLIMTYIKMKLLDSEAEHSNVMSSKKFQEQRANVEKQLLQQAYLDNLIESNVTEKMKKDEYHAFVEALKGKEEIQVSHILVEKEETAKKIAADLKKGKKFSELAKEFSMDPGSKNQGGEIGYITQGQLVPEFEEVAFGLKMNTISAPVKTQFGWHVITVTDKRPVKIPSQDELMPMIVNKLSRELVEKYFDKLYQKADVKFLIPIESKEQDKKMIDASKPASKENKKK